MPTSLRIAVILQKEEGLPDDRSPVTILSYDPTLVMDQGTGLASALKVENFALKQGSGEVKQSDWHQNRRPAYPEKFDYVLHDLRFSPSRGLWYTDIVIEGIDVFSPMLRLSVATYQRHAARYLQFSEPVRLYYTPLAPTRVSAASRSGHEWNIKVSGAFGQEGHRHRVSVRVQYALSHQHDALAWGDPPEGIHLMELEPEWENQKLKAFSGRIDLRHHRRRQGHLSLLVEETFKHDGKTEESIYVDRIPIH